MIMWEKPEWQKAWYLPLLTQRITVNDRQVHKQTELWLHVLHLRKILHWKKSRIQKIKRTRPLDSISRIQLVSNSGTDWPSRLQQTMAHTIIVFQVHIIAHYPHLKEQTDKIMDVCEYAMCLEHTVYFLWSHLVLHRILTANVLLQDWGPIYKISYGLS